MFLSYLWVFSCLWRTLQVYYSIAIVAFLYRATGANGLEQASTPLPLPQPDI